MNSTLKFSFFTIFLTFFISSSFAITKADLEAVYSSLDLDAKFIVKSYRNNSISLADIHILINRLCLDCGGDSYRSRKRHNLADIKPIMIKLFSKYDYDNDWPVLFKKKYNFHGPTQGYSNVLNYELYPVSRRQKEIQDAYLENGMHLVDDFRGAYGKSVMSALRFIQYSKNYKPGLSDIAEGSIDYL